MTFEFCYYNYHKPYLDAKRAAEEKLPGAWDSVAATLGIKAAAAKEIYDHEHQRTFYAELLRRGL
jgi:hypothetical protein